MKTDYYWRARSYAHRLEPELYRDIVHDAFIDYARLNNINLFEEPLPLIFRVVKYKWHDFLKAKYGYSPKRYFEPYDDHQLTSVTAQQIMEGQELDDRIKGFSSTFKNNNKNPKLLDSIIDLRRRGYLVKEVAEVLGIETSLVSYYLKRLMSYINNPFTAKKEKGRSISLNQWDKLSDKEDYQEEEVNEYYRYYKHKESSEGLLVKLPAEKTNPYIK